MPDFIKNAENWQSFVGVFIAILVAIGSFVSASDAQHEANSARAMAVISQQDMHEIHANRARVESKLGQLSEKISEIDTRLHRMDARVDEGDRELVILVKEVITDFRRELGKSDSRYKDLISEYNTRADRLGGMLTTMLGLMNKSTVEK